MYPGSRPSGGKQYLDHMERLNWQKGLDIFGLDKEGCGINVQHKNLTLFNLDRMLNGNAFSCALANLYIYTALMNLGDYIMGLDLAHGGYISHGYQTSKERCLRLLTGSNPQLIRQWKTLCA